MISYEEFAIYFILGLTYVLIGVVIGLFIRGAT